MNPIAEPAPLAAVSISLQKRILFTAVFVGVVLLLVEFFSFVGLWIVDGSRFSWSRMQDERDEVLATYGPAKNETSAARSEAPHPYLGYVRNPDRQETVSEFGYPSDTPLFTRRADDRVIVAVVGGSVAFHFAKQGMPAVFARLEDETTFAGKEFVLVNLAVGGYKQPQQLMTLNYLLALGFEFDVVVNLDGFNEVALHPAENARKHVFPIYPSNWYARVDDIPDNRLRTLMGEAAVVEDRIASTATTHSGAPWRYSVTANLVWQFRHERLMQRHARAMQDFRFYEPPHSPYAVTGPRLVFGDDSDVLEHLVSVWKRSSIQLDHLCRANGIRYYHFLQPNQYFVDSKPLAREELSHAYRENHPYRPGAEAGYPLLVRDGAELVERGVRFVDLTAAFAEERGVIYSDDCCHYNEKGYRMLATPIAETILQDRGVSARVRTTRPAR